jgi:nitric oxide reductase activation protein
LKNHRAGGGNKDGYSIRVATRELEKRKEKKKILLVLSDGLPSHYKYGRDHALDDVKNAVEEARKKGIRVVSILFGDNSFARASEDDYKYMYKYNIIKCTPENIGRKILPIFKTIVSQ